jgi:hypothetical protein
LPAEKGLLPQSNPLNKRAQQIRWTNTPGPGCAPAYQTAHLLAEKGLIAQQKQLNRRAQQVRWTSTPICPRKRACFPSQI